MLTYCYSFFSFFSCGIANLLDDADFEGMLGLALAYMYEKSIGPASPWYEYLETIDQTTLAQENPRFWSAQDQDLLVGTELFYHTLKVEDDDVAEVYKYDVLPFLERNNLFEDQPEYRTLECYRDSLLAVASRAFDVDVYHGLSLVPGACLFNHSENEDVHFEVQSQVCPLCGSAEICEHSIDRIKPPLHDESFVDDDNDTAAAPNGNGNGNEAGDAEMLDVSNPNNSTQAPEGLSEEGLSSSFEFSDDESDDGFEDIDDDDQEDGSEGDEEDGENEDGEFDDEDDEEDYPEDTADTCDLVTIRPIPAGKEVFNTYGELSNHFLASRYGFALWGNIHETVGLSPEISDYIHDETNQKTNPNELVDLEERLSWWSRCFYAALYNIKPDEYDDLLEEQELARIERQEAAEAAAAENGEEYNDEEEEEEAPPNPEQISWEDEAYITSTGIPSQGLVKMIKLLTMTNSEFSSLCERFENGDYSTGLDNSSSSSSVTRPGVPQPPTTSFSDQEKSVFKTLLKMRALRYKDGQMTSKECYQVIDGLEKIKAKLIKKQKEKLRKSNSTLSKQAGGDSATDSTTSPLDEIDLSLLDNQRKILGMTIRGTEKLVLERANIWLDRLDQKKKTKKIGGNPGHSKKNKK